MLIVEVPAALPGCCKMCGSANRDFFIDTETTEEFYGAVYYCNNCAGYIAHLMGWVAPEELRQIKAYTEALEGQVVELLKYKTSLEGILTDALGSRVDGINLVNLSRPDCYDSPYVEYKLQHGESEVGSGEGEITEPLHDERLALVPSKRTVDGDPGGFVL